ncbi:MAG: Uncharacterized protein FD147_816 [Chloroflexi bacterium]|nr:MAG: Uncharacterized protein FD147_816 [Chloroflexota bacterium]MBA4376993.1 hypothetical protein [Anaerolinea sp.]
MKPALIFVFVLLFASFVLSSCSVVDSLQPIQGTVESGTLLFKDDFSVNPNGWGTMGRAGGEIGFEFEGLTIKVNTPNFLFWTVNGSRYRDTRIEVDAVLLDGPADDNFGVICRFKDNKNFYGFVISHDGYYGIFKMLDGTLDLATSASNLDYSEDIRKGGVVNHITVVCQDDILRLTVNDALLSEIQDSSFDEGQVGLIAGAYEFGGVKVLFDNLDVYQP